MRNMQSRRIGWLYGNIDSVHISGMCYVSGLKVTRCLQHGDVNGLFVQNSGDDAE